MSGGNAQRYEIQSLTPSSTVNFLRSSSANAPGVPSGITKTSCMECMSNKYSAGWLVLTWTVVIAAMERTSSPHEKSLDANNYMKWFP